MKLRSGKLVIVTCLISLFGIQAGMAQEFVTKRIKKEKVIKLEKKMNSEQIKLDDTTPVSNLIYPFDYFYKLSNPLHFQRENSEFTPQPQTKYYFNLENDELCFAEYSWQIENQIDLSDTKAYYQMLKGEEGRLDEYKAFYEDLVKDLEAYFGPATEDHGYDLAEQFEQQIHSRKVKFIKDGQYAYLQMWYPTKGVHPGLQRIVLRVYWD